MYNFSILIDDKTAPGLEQKIELCNDLLINNIELNDKINGINLTDLDGLQIENLRNILIRNNKKIVLLNCSCPLNEDNYYRQILRKAHMLNIENIRVDLEGMGNDKELIAKALKNLNSIGKSYGINVLCENNSKTYLSAVSSITDLYKRLNEYFDGFIFNPLEFAKMRVHPFLNVFYNSRIKNEIRFLRINDGLFIDGSPALPGHGNAEVKEMTSALLARGFKGYFSFTPYFCNMDFQIYSKVIGKFKRLLMEL